MADGPPIRPAASTEALSRAAGASQANYDEAWNAAIRAAVDALLGRSNGLDFVGELTASRAYREAASLVLRLRRGDDPIVRKPKTLLGRMLRALRRDRETPDA